MLASMLQWVRQGISKGVSSALLARMLVGAAIGCTVVLGAMIARVRQDARATARLNSAVQRLDATARRLASLLEGSTDDDLRRAAIAWGYTERLRLGLEGPFRLVDAAARDPRLAMDQRRTVAWALLSHVLLGEINAVDPAALDLLGATEEGRSIPGTRHLELIERTVARADNPRAGELAVRFAYTLAATERLLDASAPMLASQAAAMVADRELARREAAQLIRSAGRADPIEIVRRRRARRAFYVERPVLLAPDDDVEREAIALIDETLQALRAMRPDAAPAQERAAAVGATAPMLVRRLAAAGAELPPSAPLVVTIRRYLPLVRANAPHLRLDADALARTLNSEMLVAASRAVPPGAGRLQQRVVGRMLLAAAVSMRSQAQEPVWFPGDSVPGAAQVAATLGIADIVFDSDVPTAWRPYFVQAFANSVNDLRRVLPAVRLDGLHVRFRLKAPSDSALAMHDPRTRTVHLPVLTAGGTLSHELAHDLDRQSAARNGLAGYRSDIAAREGERTRLTWLGTVGGTRNSERLAASLRALTEEPAAGTPSTRPADRPAEIFATRVDWFIAGALARAGISNGFLSAVEDEVLTGHVVHMDRLRSSGRSRSLVTALEAMTPVAPSAARDDGPTAQSLLRWALAAPVDRRVARDVVRGDFKWRMPAEGCDDDSDGRARLTRVAAESRARGWLRTRARWMADSVRPVWARAILSRGPWSDAAAREQVGALSDYFLLQLTSGEELPAGLGAYGASVAMRARCTR